MSDLSSLIARLEAAEGPNYALEVDIFKFFNPEYSDYVQGRGGLVHKEDGEDQRVLSNVRPPNVMASLDAAVSLANRVLPGWFWRCGSTPLFPNGWAHVSRYRADHCDRQDEASCADGKAANVAIALVLTTLRALQQKGSSNG
jgi:hypothetical protein